MLGILIEMLQPTERFVFYEFSEQIIAALPESA